MGKGRICYSIVGSKNHFATTVAAAAETAVDIDDSIKRKRFRVSLKIVLSNFTCLELLQRTSVGTENLQFYLCRHPFCNLFYLIVDVVCLPPTPDSSTTTNSPCQLDKASGGEISLSTSDRDCRTCRQTTPAIGLDESSPVGGMGHSALYSS